MVTDSSTPNDKQKSTGSEEKRLSHLPAKPAGMFARCLTWFQYQLEALRIISNYYKNYELYQLTRDFDK